MARIESCKICHMKIAFVFRESITNLLEDSITPGLQGRDPVWWKAKGLAERGHEVWGLTPDDRMPRARRWEGGRLTDTTGGMGFGKEVSPSMSGSWPAIAAKELLRLHHDQAIDIIDIPSDFTAMCRYLAIPSGRGRMPAIVQIGGAPPANDQVCEAQVPLYRFEGEISFTPANPIESHIAILRLENFLHGVLNRHFAMHQPAA
jgi:hypothetical protein